MAEVKGTEQVPGWSMFWYGVGGVVVVVAGPALVN